MAVVAACGLAAPDAAVAEDIPCPVPTTETDPMVVGMVPGCLVTGVGAEVVLAGIARLPADPDAAEGWGDGTLPPTAEGPLRLLPTAPPDRYGRQPGLLFDADGALVQAGLVRDGDAVVRPEGIDEACARNLLGIESAAREARAGLWANANNVAKATDKSSLLARNGLYVLVEGRIVSTGYGSRMVFLDFGRSFRTDFTVMVAESLVSRLREAGFPVESLEGRKVRVRGIIEESGGPAIRLASPLALELVDVME